MTASLQYRFIATADLAVKRFVDGELANRYLHGPLVDQLLVDERVDASESLNRWVLTDHQGTVRDLAVRDAITDEIIISNHRVFDAFGTMLSETAGGETTIFGYAGREWEEVADLQFNRARWYDPTIGRWINQDPIGFAAGDANLYRYVGNEATTKVDPSGLEEKNPITVSMEIDFYWHYNLPRLKPSQFDNRADYERFLVDDRKYSEEAAIKTYRESFAFLIAKFDECQRKFGIHGPGKRDIDWTFHPDPIVTDWDDVPNDERSELYQKRQKAVEALAAGRKGKGVRVLISSHRAGQGVSDTATNSIVITTNAALDTLAHEMGHLAHYNTLPDLADGFLSHCKDKNNVMSFPPEGDRSNAIIDIYWATGFQKWFASHRRR